MWVKTQSIFDKLKSRKFWLTFAGGVVVLFAKQLGLDVDESQLWQLVALITGYGGVNALAKGK